MIKLARATKHQAGLALQVATCTVYIEDCEGWWLPGGCSSVVRTLAAQATSPVFGSWEFLTLYFLFFSASYHQTLFSGN